MTQRALIGSALLVFIPAVGVGLSGCTGGVDLGEVSGTVTLDGAPLAQAQVYFLPAAGGRPAMATTDAEGNYKLFFDNFKYGALVGRHEVKISTFYPPSANFDEDDKLVRTPERPERLPKRYHEQTELSAEIKSGKNVCNFDLKSK